MKRIYGGGEVAQKYATFELQMIKNSEDEAQREKQMVGAGEKKIRLLVLNDTLFVFFVRKPISIIHNYSSAAPVESFGGR